MLIRAAATDLADREPDVLDTSDYYETRQKRPAVNFGVFHQFGSRTPSNMSSFKRIARLFGVAETAIDISIRIFELLA